MYLLLGELRGQGTLGADFLSDPRNTINDVVLKISRQQGHSSTAKTLMGNGYSWYK
jgi:hypothetical protein